MRVTQGETSSRNHILMPREIMLSLATDRQKEVKKVFHFTFLHFTRMEKL